MSLMTEDRFDPAKDAVNREKHKLPLAFGNRIFADDGHLIIPSIREIDGEERLKVVGIVGGEAVHRRFRLAGRLASLHLGEKEQQG
ncbi:BrnT family toxin [Mesorhizobium muleiense]|uniref:BrnT family toxin n=1 Tax=Mesorhizobium muleiense TaxID=1004279 RepID=UPI001F2280A1|nr:BrnT family toxin [Mesorhizobium muleiense]MCF6116062.1 BrnT family toxin [Mesorhizobium muleiense]